MKFQTHLLFQTFLVVYNFMDSHKDMNINKFRIPTAKYFFKGGKYETFVEFVLAPQHEASCGSEI